MAPHVQENRDQREGRQAIPVAPSTSLSNLNVPQTPYTREQVERASAPIEKDPRLALLEASQKRFDLNQKTANDLAVGMQRNIKDTQAEIDDTWAISFKRMSGHTAGLRTELKAEQDALKKQKENIERLEEKRKQAAKEIEQFKKLEEEGKKLNAEGSPLAQVKFNQAQLAFLRAQSIMEGNSALGKEASRALKDGLNAANAQYEEAIGDLDTTEKWLNRGHTACVVAGATVGTILTGGALAGALASGGALATTGAALGTVGTSAVTFVGSVAGGTAVGGVGIGAVSNGVEASAHVAVGNKTGEQAYADAKAKSYQDVKTAFTTSASTAVSMGTGNVLNGAVGRAFGAKATEIGGRVTYALTTGQRAVAGAGTGLASGVASTGLNTGITLYEAKNEFEKSYQGSEEDREAAWEQFKEERGLTTERLLRDGAIDIAVSSVGGSIGSGAGALREGAKSVSKVSGIIAGELGSDVAIGVGSAAVKARLDGRELTLDEIEEEVFNSITSTLRGEVQDRASRHQRTPKNMRDIEVGELDAKGARSVKLGEVSGYTRRHPDNENVVMYRAEGDNPEALTKQYITVLRQLELQERHFDMSTEKIEQLAKKQVENIDAYFDPKTKAILVTDYGSEPHQVAKTEAKIAHEQYHIEKGHPRQAKNVEELHSIEFGAHKAEIESIQKSGYQPVIIDGKIEVGEKLESGQSARVVSDQEIRDLVKGNYEEGDLVAARSKRGRNKGRNKNTQKKPANSEAKKESVSGVQKASGGSAEKKSDTVGETSSGESKETSQPELKGSPSSSETTTITSQKNETTQIPVSKNFEPEVQENVADIKPKSPDAYAKLREEFGLNKDAKLSEVVGRLNELAKSTEKGAEAKLDDYLELAGLQRSDLDKGLVGYDYNKPNLQVGKDLPSTPKGARAEFNLPEGASDKVVAQRYFEQKYLVQQNLEKANVAGDQARIKDLKKASNRLDSLLDVAVGDRRRDELRDSILGKDKPITNRAELLEVISKKEAFHRKEVDRLKDEGNTPSNAESIRQNLQAIAILRGMREAEVFPSQARIVELAIARAERDERGNAMVSLPIKIEDLYKDAVQNKWEGFAQDLHLNLNDIKAREESRGKENCLKAVARINNELANGRVINKNDLEIIVKPELDRITNRNPNLSSEEQMRRAIKSTYLKAKAAEASDDEARAVFLAIAGIGRKKQMPVKLNLQRVENANKEYYSFKNSLSPSDRNDPQKVVSLLKKEIRERAHACLFGPSAEKRNEARTYLSRRLLAAEHLNASVPQGKKTREDLFRLAFGVSETRPNDNVVVARAARQAEVLVNKILHNEARIGDFEEGDQRTEKLYENLNRYYGGLEKFKKECTNAGIDGDKVIEKAIGNRARALGEIEARLVSDLSYTGDGHRVVENGEINYHNASLAWNKQKLGHLLAQFLGAEPTKVGIEIDRQVREGVSNYAERAYMRALDNHYCEEGGSFKDVYSEQIVRRNSKEGVVSQSDVRSEVSAAEPKKGMFGSKRRGANDYSLTQEEFKKLEQRLEAQYEKRARELGVVTQDVGKVRQEMLDEFIKSAESALKAKTKDELDEKIQRLVDEVRELQKVGNSNNDEVKWLNPDHEELEELLQAILYKSRQRVSEIKAEAKAEVEAEKAKAEAKEEQAKSKLVEIRRKNRTPSEAEVKAAKEFFGISDGMRRAEKSLAIQDLRDELMRGVGFAIRGDNAFFTRRREFYSHLRNLDEETMSILFHVKSFGEDQIDTYVEERGKLEKSIKENQRDKRSIPFRNPLNWGKLSDANAWIRYETIILERGKAFRAINQGVEDYANSALRTHSYQEGGSFMDVHSKIFTDDNEGGQSHDRSIENVKRQMEIRYESEARERGIATKKVQEARKAALDKIRERANDNFSKCRNSNELDRKLQEIAKSISALSGQNNDNEKNWSKPSKEELSQLSDEILKAKEKRAEELQKSKAK